MNWMQHHVELAPRSRGFHIITSELEAAIPDLSGIAVGLCHIMILHTSAGLTLNENADPDVRTDFATIFGSLVPENDRRYVHTLEGPDDMPAHVKSSLVGSAVTVPLRNGRFVLGTWQGIYLCEFRNRGGSRRVVVTAFGESSPSRS
jgi:secondary thiamine-phosphate synthase enzyme